MARLNSLCCEDNSGFLDQDENYDPAKILNSLSAWISSLKASHSPL